MNNYVIVLSDLIKILVKPGGGRFQLQGLEITCPVGLALAQHVRAQVLHAGC